MQQANFKESGIYNLLISILQLNGIEAPSESELFMKSRFRRESLHDLAVELITEKLFKFSNAQGKKVVIKVNFENDELFVNDIKITNNESFLNQLSSIPVKTEIRAMPVNDYNSAASLVYAQNQGWMSLKDGLLNARGERCTFYYIGNKEEALVLFNEFQSKMMKQSNDYYSQLHV